MPLQQCGFFCLCVPQRYGHSCSSLREFMNFPRRTEQKLEMADAKAACAKFAAIARNDHGNTKRGRDDQAVYDRVRQEYIEVHGKFSFYTKTAIPRWQISCVKICSYAPNMLLSCLHRRCYSIDSHHCKRRSRNEIFPQRRRSNLHA